MTKYASECTGGQILKALARITRIYLDLVKIRKN
jgi:hypothetical protein